MEKDISLFKNIWQRRVPHILGIYLGACWAIVEFISSLLVDRYLLSPLLIDFGIVILLSLIPSVLLIAYFHGKPGKDEWTKFEKIGIPVNIVITLIILLIFFNNKDLGATTKKITFENEEGEKVERVIPKTEFRKKISTFPFLNESADSTYNWLQYGLDFAIAFDLTQDIFVQRSNIYQSDMLGEYFILEKMRRFGFHDGVGIPLTLKKKIAQESFMEYFLSGSFTVNNETFTIKTELYETSKGKLIGENTFTGKDIFKLTDEISLKLKENLEIPQHHLDETKDLPVAEILTNSIPAYQKFITGFTKLFENDYSAALNNVETAIKEDPDFAMAYFILSGIYSSSTQTEKIEQNIHSAMQKSYKLPELYKFIVKILYYSSKQEIDKAITLSKMRIELYPDDIFTYNLLAMFYMSKNLVNEEIEVYKSILKIDPFRYGLLKKIGSLYEKNGKIDEALIYLKQYADQFPEDSSSYTAIGNLYKSFGNYSQAKKFYEKAILLEPENVSILINLSNIEEIAGNYMAAFEQYQSSLNFCQTPKDSAEVYLSLSSYYETRGQINRSIEYLKMELNEGEKFQSPLVLIFGKFGFVDKYMKIGKKEMAFQTIEMMKTHLSPPLDQFLSVAKMKIYKQLEDSENLEKAIDEVEILIKTFGVEMIRSKVVNAKGKLFEIEEEFEQAALMYKKELELKPTNVKINMYIGNCYRKLTEFNEALEYFQKIVTILPFDPETHYELALLYNDMGKKEKALEHLNISLEVWKDADPEYIAVRKAREKMREWQGNI